MLRHSALETLYKVGKYSRSFEILANNEVVLEAVKQDGRALHRHLHRVRSARHRHLQEQRHGRRKGPWHGRWIHRGHRDGTGRGADV